MEKLVELKTSELLNKFGKGNHIPGSGSAAALNALLSAELLKTVIDITNEEKHRSNYLTVLPKLLTISNDIVTRILPRLEELFQKDSDEFDKVIQCRKARDKEEDIEEKKKLAQQAVDALVPAVEIPIEIATLSAMLVQYSAYVFDNAFKSARGDSGVALNSAVAAISGSLSIIYLNLKTCDDSEWKEVMMQSAEDLQKKLAGFINLSQDKIQILKSEVEFNSELQFFKTFSKRSKDISISDVEDIARRLQNMLWQYRDKIWNTDIPSDTLDVLKADIVLEKMLKYKVSYHSTLGIHDNNGERFEIAGLIDKSKKIVEISERYSPETQIFTTAHELGHAILHNQTVLHRDRPLDGSSGNQRDEQEIQADKFAAFFLMPRKRVQAIFKDRFSLDKLVVTENIVFGFTGSTKVSDFRKQCKDLHGFALYVASAEYFGGREFVSLAEVFGVSVKTMAIRLEELGLLEF